jgi:hypothetical protein
VFAGLFQFQPIALVYFANAQLSAKQRSLTAIHEAYAIGRLRMIGRGDDYAHRAARPYERAGYVTLLGARNHLCASRDHQLCVNVVHVAPPITISSSLA